MIDNDYSSMSARCLGVHAQVSFVDSSNASPAIRDANNMLLLLQCCYGLRSEGDAHPALDVPFALRFAAIITVRHIAAGLGLCIVA